MSINTLMRTIRCKWKYLARICVNTAYKLFFFWHVNQFICSYGETRQYGKLRFGKWNRPCDGNTKEVYIPSPSLTSLRTRRRPELASPLTHSVEGHHPHHVHFYWSSHSLEYHIMNRHYVRPFGTWGHIEWWPLIIEIINGHHRVRPQLRSLRAHGGSHKYTSRSLPVI